MQPTVLKAFRKKKTAKIIFQGERHYDELGRVRSALWKHTLEIQNMSKDARKKAILGRRNSEKTGVVE